MAGDPVTVFAHHPELVAYGRYGMQIAPVCRAFRGGERVPHLARAADRRAAGGARPDRRLPRPAPRLARGPGRAERLGRAVAQAAAARPPRRQPGRRGAAPNAWCRNGCAPASASGGGWPSARSCPTRCARRSRASSPRIAGRSPRSFPATRRSTSAIRSCGDDGGRGRGGRHRPQRGRAARALPRLARAGGGPGRLRRLRARPTAASPRRAPPAPRWSSSTSSLPFTAARARNEGLRAAGRGRPAALSCSSSTATASCSRAGSPPPRRFLAAHPDVAVVCGRRRERHPEASLYNRLCRHRMGHARRRGDGLRRRRADAQRGAARRSAASTRG